MSSEPALLPASALRSLEKCIGRGGFAQVYLCTVLKDGNVHSAALKILRPLRAGPVPKVVERLFLSEAKSCMELNHW